MQHNKPNNTFYKSHYGMAATAPVAIGTRGTIGSLIKKEIDYFAKIELETSISSQRSQGPEMASSGCRSSPPTFWQSIMSWRRKKKLTSNRFITKMCSTFDASRSNRMNKISGICIMGSGSAREANKQLLLNMMGHREREPFSCFKFQSSRYMRERRERKRISAEM
ncbi:hypothetical protein E5676_scaffold248G005900 [Cucumis melo var. makuwa]|uniref:Uncharacterized protein n=1 Tax=Cucumis melo var. makuwa TaxID=1194695 RepID=A0A5A7UTL1_CUCMM|nr:hypothetical protein E6C27_scaffold96G00380 [Cucumis melo var. makuwa]TYJ99372.1 hypothetical protein E5676_scaffold248G005900 [Cucumis melo var. makuwa]